MTEARRPVISPARPRARRSGLSPSTTTW
jgi:hypothetical protein